MNWHNELNDFQLPEDFVSNCEIYAKLLLSYNKIHNISGAKNISKVYENIIDSVYPVKYIKEEPKEAIDIGSGAGFPGIVLALALPNTNFTLFEPISKKSSFLHLVKSSLKLKNIQISSQRVEESEAFKCDFICSRAVSDTKMLISLCFDYINPKTTLLFYKGSRTEDEIEGIKNYTIHKRGQRRYLFLKDV